MAIGEGLIVNAISEIVKKAATEGWRALKRKDKTLEVLKKIGLEPGRPEPVFESVYAHALVEYGLDQPESILNFFRHEDIQKAFQESFTKNDFSILYNEAGSLIDWNRIGDDLRDADIDPRDEFAAFTLVFNAMVTLTRTPAELQDHQKLDEIIKLIKEGDQEKIRAKNVEMIQGSLPDQLKKWFQTLGYTITGHEKQTEKYFELIVNIPARRGFDRILVRYIEHQAEIDDVEALLSSVQQHDVVEGWLVAAHRVSRTAEEEAQKGKFVFCYTFDELLDDHADFSKYFDWLEKYVKDRHINSDYIPLACKRELIDKETNEKKGEEIYGKDHGWIEGYIACLSGCCTTYSAGRLLRVKSMAQPLPQ
ncbi:MAG: restriction endonuclease [Desulfobacteraceae bacterium]|nr:restriction endonuclease [Desulfobacteraceae bacterium]